jgi:hypothetical protein
MIEAGLLALSGKTSEALAGYRANQEAWRDLGLAFDVALTAIDMATLIGPGEPAVVAAAEEARGILEGLGARRFLARLEAAMGWGEASRPAPSTLDTAPVAAPANASSAGSKGAGACSSAVAS